MIIVGESGSGITDVTVNVKVRRPWTVAALTIITFGIYSIVWVYRVNRELRDYGAASGENDLAQSRPWRTVLAVTIGGLIVIPALVAYVHTVGRVQDAERIATGERRAASGLIALWVGAPLLSFASAQAGSPLALVLSAFLTGVAAITLTQARLNGVWRNAGVAGLPSVEAVGLGAG